MALESALSATRKASRRRSVAVRRTGLALIVATVLLAGCGGGTAAGEDGLRDGVYEFELTEEYLLENGIPARQARSESGAHEITLDQGSFADRWRNADGITGFCSGEYTVDGNRVTFRWTGGCTGDWAMSYSLDGDVVTWSDFEPLGPSSGPDDQKLVEVFNGVPWKRTGDVPDEAEE